MTEPKRMTAGAALLSRFSALGVDFVFANSGTDFPPVIEGLSEAEAEGMSLPRTVTVPFESAAIGMAHGYALATGKPQAVMVHTNVGLANVAMGAINAACDNIPMLLFSGRTPTLEKGRLGARTVPIGWGQEMLDQASLVREATKWDYELRFPEQIFDVTDRAYGIATSTPKGPVYVSLPRDALARLAEQWGIPVCQYWAVELAMSMTHPMATGPDPRPWLEKADVILCLDALAPWSPADVEPQEDATVIQIGPRPLQDRSGVRNFRCDIGITSEVAPAILALEAALHRFTASDVTKERGKDIAQKTAVDRAARFDAALAGEHAASLTKRWVSHELSLHLSERDSAIFSELGCQLPSMKLERHQSWFDGPHSGGLGWGFPAAMGFALARPDKTVVATMGDGSYMFANPVACHQIAEALDISMLVIVLNNSEWGAVRQSVLDIYPDGHASRANAVPLTDLSPSPNFVKVAEASRAFACHARDVAGFRKALSDALAHVDAKKGLAFIEVAVGKS